MFIIPAIDVRNNNCVRLKKGNLNKIFIFSKNPLLVFNKLLNQNITRLHIVDLDGAVEGRPKNLLTIKNIIKYNNRKVKIQVGGGIRNLETIEYYFDQGCDYVILGTKAILDLNFLETICQKYSNKVIIGLDVKKFKLAINGWKNYYDLDLIKYLKLINNYSLESLIYTDINKDGMFDGFNIKLFYKISKYFNKPIIISGGLSSLKNIKDLYLIQKRNLLGVIGGSSIYYGKINLKSSINKIKYFNRFYL